jgi:hypothetical protein
MAAALQRSGRESNAESNGSGIATTTFDPGGHSRRQRPQAAKVRCPETYLWQPAETVCPNCDVLHSE